MEYVVRVGWTGETYSAILVNEDDPRDIQSISFNPNGDVLNGNIYKNCIMDILNTYSVDD